MTARRGVNMGVLVGGLAVVLPLVWLLRSGFGNDPHAVPSVLEHKPAPEFKLVDLQGKTWQLDELRGKPVVLNFWSTWCLPCKQEFPLFQQAALAYPDVQFLGVLYNDDPAKAVSYLQRQGSTFDHLLDPDGRVAIDYGVAGVPETYFIDPKGVIVHKQIGPLSGPAMQSLLALAGGGAP